MAIGTSKRRKNQAEAAERQWAANSPADYVNQNKEAMDAVTGQVGSGFDWNTAADAYQQYRQRATQSAQAAADNAKANAANLAGGYGSSYADSVAAQNQRQALAGIDNALPSLRSQALAEYQDKQNSLLNAHPEWVCTVNEGAYLNPAIPEAADYVVQGVAELVQNYAVDGIHFDDYFYPTTDPSIDAAQFAASGEADLTAWRRANVTRLVKAAHDAVKAADPTLRFGVSPQGNPDNDRNEQYTDLSVWLTASGADAVVDYLCPQIYWGYGYTLSSGSTRFAFENITAEWLVLPRAESTALYFGLGAYRVGVGDGGANADSVSQWCTGSALARQVTDLRSAGAGGWALYRYGSLFRSDESGLAAAERAALTALDG